MNSSISDLTVPQLKRAVLIKQKIERLQHQLEAIIGTGSTEKLSTIRTRRKMSAAAKARISAAQRKRWAKFHAAKARK